MTEFLDSFSEETWTTTYKDHNDATVDDTFRRTANAIASVEETEKLRKEWSQKFYNMQKDFKVVVGGRILSNAGTEWKGTTLINCFVSPIPDYDIDSLDSIFENLKKQAKTLKSEGGWGHNFSALRPRGSFIHGVGVESPGTVRFMELYDKSSEIVTSGSGKKHSNIKAKGKIRKGAMMAVLDCWHPDIVEFITAKQTPGRLTKFNVSVNCTDDFMLKLLLVTNGEKEGMPANEIDSMDKWDLKFPDTTFENYKKEWDGNLKKWEEKGYPVNIYSTISIRWLWNLIMESTYNKNEPGVLFMDRANYFNPLNYGETIQAVNPCLIGDTWIITNKGVFSIRNIAKNYTDFKVLSYNESSNCTEFADIKWAGKTKENVPVIYITIEDITGDIYGLTLTPDHKIYTRNRGYVEASTLKQEDDIAIINDYLIITGKMISRIMPYKNEDVFDISTANNNHNFFANNILVHNCGEQFLAPAGICCLGSVNLTQFINDDFTNFDYKKIKTHLVKLVRFLDNVNSYSETPLPEYKQNMTDKRRIGCGMMGWGSALMMMKLPFSSKKAREIRDELSKNFVRYAYEASIDLAEEKGMFPLCDIGNHIESPIIKKIGLSDVYLKKMKKHGIRNSALVSIQPTGNTSVFANVVSGGIEPIFMTEYKRSVIVSHIPEEIRDMTPKFFEGKFEETSLFKFAKEGDEQILRGEHNGTVYKIDKNRGLTKEVNCEDYGVRYLKNIGEWNKNAVYAKSTTETLSPEDHINDLKGFAEFVDSGISKTINLPYDYPFDKFKDIYIDAYNTGFIKGLTTYRSGTMTSVLAAKDEKYVSDIQEEIILDDVKLPSISPATMKIIRAEGKKWYLTVILNETQTRPFALFAHTNAHEKTITTNDAIEKLLDLAKSKGIPNAHIKSTEEKINAENNVGKICRIISLCLRHGILIKNIINVLDDIKDIFAGSFVFQIKKVLSSYIKDGEKIEGKKCSECGSDSLIFSEGCVKCANCSNSRC